MKRGVVYHTRLALAAFLLIGAMLACNAPFAAPPTVPPDTTLTPTPAPFSGPPPKVSIDAPAANAQAVVGQPFRIRAHATDGVGVTRLEMRESGRIVAAQSLVAANVDFTGLLEYRPTQTGTITLDVIAYRDAIASDPASVTITIVASVAQLSNPSSLDPTLQVAAGPICTEQVTVSGLALHTGPGTSFHLITTLTSGETVSVTGRTADSKWYAVRRQNGANGWVSATYVKASGDCSAAPITTATIAPP